MFFPSRLFSRSSSATRNRPSPDSYLAQLEPTISASLTQEQRREFERILGLAIPKPSPKLVDLRFEIDLIFNRFFIVLFVGEDRRRRIRRYPVSQVTRWGNAIAATVLLMGFNLAATATVFLVAYLIKSAIGIDLFPGHLRDLIG